MSNLIVAGSRDLIHNQHCVVVANAIQQWISEHGPVTRVLCGDCRGADTFGRHWAETVGVSVLRYQPDWDRYGKAAGPFRNRAMVRDADGLVVVRYRDSRGSKNVLGLAQEKGIPIVDVLLERPV
jgi:hypothetical protein